MDICKNKCAFFEKEMFCTQYVARFYVKKKACSSVVLESVFYHRKLVIYLLPLIIANIYL